jgi:hypothetical protein
MGESEIHGAIRELKDQREKSSAAALNNRLN